MHDSPTAPAHPSRRGVLALGLGLGASVALSGRARAEDEAPAPLVVYAVRHAEKGAGRDPELTEEGAARAQELARVLADAPLGAVYSTDTQRTRLTAQPAAQAHELEIQGYAPGTLAAKLVGGEARTVLVVGHSNTTPDLIRELGGSFDVKILPGYDALLIAVVIPGGPTLFQQLHYGAPSTSGGH
ncbi:MAG: histidine phosphatase family protein [Planctomycetota bacterium]